MQAIGRQPKRASDGAPVHYERHRPELTTLYRLVQHHAATFIAETEVATGADLPQFVKDEFDACLECGILTHGFLRLRCADCGLIDALGLLQAAGGVPDDELQAHLRAFDFRRIVSLLPTWESIYTTDSERDHPFEHAARVCHQLRAWYRHCGFQVQEPPCLPVAARADELLRRLSEAPAAAPHQVTAC